MAAISNMPFRSALGRVVGQMVTVADDWRRWLQELKDGIDLAARRVGAAVSLTAQEASIGTTAVSTPALVTGLYRVSWVLRVTQAASTSGSVALSVTTTADGVGTTQTGTALATNTLGAALSGVFVVSVDVGTAISYATAYASVGATPFQYALGLNVEAMS